MSGVATAVIGAAIIGGGVSSYQSNKNAKAQRSEMKEVQAANNKKDAMYNLMSVIGGEGAKAMNMTQPIDQTKSNMMLDMISSGMGAVGPGLMTGQQFAANKQNMANQNLQADYTKALTEGQGLNNQWLQSLNEYRNQSPQAYLQSKSMPPWMMGMPGFGTGMTAPSGPTIGGFTPSK